MSARSVSDPPLRRGEHASDNLIALPEQLATGRACVTSTAELLRQTVHGVAPLTPKRHFIASGTEFNEKD